MTSDMLLCMSSVMTVDMYVGMYVGTSFSMKNPMPFVLTDDLYLDMSNSMLSY